MARPKGIPMSESEKIRVSERLKKAYAEGRRTPNDRTYSEAQRRGLTFGRGLFKGTKGVMKAWNKGINHIKIQGEFNPNWKGGVTPLAQQLRHSLEYKLWRQTIFKRDDYACQICRSRSGNGKKIVLNADHIYPFAQILQDIKDTIGIGTNNEVAQLAQEWTPLWDIRNGRTLCRPCHREETFGINNKEIGVIV